MVFYCDYVERDPSGQPVKCQKEYSYASGVADHQLMSHYVLADSKATCGYYLPSRRELIDRMNKVMRRHGLGGATITAKTGYIDRHYRTIVANYEADLTAAVLLMGDRNRQKRSSENVDTEPAASTSTAKGRSQTTVDVKGKRLASKVVQPEASVSTTVKTTVISGSSTAVKDPAVEQSSLLTAADESAIEKVKKTKVMTLAAASTSKTTEKTTGNGGDLAAEIGPAPVVAALNPLIDPGDHRRTTVGYEETCRDEGGSTITTQEAIANRFKKLNVVFV